MKAVRLDIPPLSLRLANYLQLTKPRVVQLIVFCAVIGMFLAVPSGLPPLGIVLAATVGIALVAGAAAAINCLVEQKIDAVMARTRARPLPRGEVNSAETLAFSGKRRVSVKFSVRDINRAKASCNSFSTEDLFSEISSKI